MFDFTSITVVVVEETMVETRSQLCANPTVFTTNLGIGLGFTIIVPSYCDGGGGYSIREMYSISCMPVGV